MISSGQTLAQSGGFASTVGSVAGLHAPRAADPIKRLTRLLPTEFAFLRFTAGIRALLAVLIGTLLLGAARPRGGGEVLARPCRELGLKVRIVAPHGPQLRGAAAKAVLHMVNEALTNARRHTSATEVTVQLDVDLHDVLLRLRNDCAPGKARLRDFVPRSLTERAAVLVVPFPSHTGQSAPRSSSTCH